jgi:hypothetical protein
MDAIRTMERVYPAKLFSYGRHGYVVGFNDKRIGYGWLEIRQADGLQI